MTQVNNYQHTFTLTKPFKDTNYVCLFMGVSSDTSNYFRDMAAVWAKTTTSLTISHETDCSIWEYVLQGYA